MKHTQKTKRKISKKLKGRKHPEGCTCSFHWKNAGKPAPSRKEVHRPTRVQQQQLIAGRARPTNCEVCGKDTRKICFDHEHSTGKFRGWLCLGCNATLGFAEDDVLILYRLIEYLKNHNPHNYGKLVMLQGLSSSGKSTKAQEIMQADGNYIRLNKDLLREMLHFNVFSGKREGFTVDAERALARYFLTHGSNVIIDDTNMGERHKQSWQTVAKECNASFESTFIDTDLETCLNRNTNRANPVPAHVIVQMAMQYQMYPQPKKSVVICDIDGTLADASHRLHFVEHSKDCELCKLDPTGNCAFKKDWNSFFDRVYYDAVRWTTVNLLLKYVQQGHPFILVSGRPERCRKNTEKWLFEKIYDTLEWGESPSHVTLLMRQDHDKRDDDVVKTDIYEKFLKHYPIEVVIDDRPRVLRAWARVGLKIIDVGSGVEF